MAKLENGNEHIDIYMTKATLAALHAIGAQMVKDGLLAQSVNGGIPIAGIIRVMAHNYSTLTADNKRLLRKVKICEEAYRKTAIAKGETPELIYEDIDE